MDTVTQDAIQSEREFVEFFDDNEEYRHRITSMINKKEKRLLVNINDLRRENPNRSTKLINDGIAELLCAQKALKRVVQNVDPEYAKGIEEFFVGFEGSFGRKHVTPRNLDASVLGQMICVEGIAIKCSTVNPKMVKSVHFCPSTKKFSERKYSDMISGDGFPSSGVYPTKDEDGNLLETEYGMSVYRDHQTFTVQEMPENAPAGQLLRSVDVIVENDLVDNCKPGDRVQIVGHFRCLAGKRNGYTTANFKAIIVANNVKLLSQESGPVFSEEDISSMRSISRRKDIVEILAGSLAPTIHGHDQVKQAILYQLLGGVERSLDNGTRIRGDINVLLMGDPSVAKSQFLRYVMQIAHRAVITTGRGSSGAGLTAAVTVNHETGERQLEAGAMVLADRGIACIDEFDKMSDIDRTAIHEVMEQGRVTISKAGIQAKLNARCSVLGAANPVYGRYDEYKTPMENIGLQDSLLSRFDLLFILLDKADSVNDRMIAEHVLRIHRYRAPNEQDGEALPLQSNMRLLSTTANLNAADAQNFDNEDDEEDQEGGKDKNKIYEDKSQLFLSKSEGPADRKTDIFTTKFLQKYLHVARQLKPKLTKEASTILSEKYCDLRMNEGSANEQSRDGIMRRTQPITPRTLETLIRLATANAKARMSKTVTTKDADAATDLLSFVLFREVLNKASRKRTRAEDEEESDEEVANRARRPRREGASQNEYEIVDMDTNNTDPNDPYAFPSGEPMASVPEKIPESKHTEATKIVSRVFQDKKTDNLPLNEVIDALKQSGGFNEAQAKDFLSVLDEKNKVMLADSNVYLI